MTAHARRYQLLKTAHLLCVGWWFGGSSSLILLHLCITPANPAELQLFMSIATAIDNMSIIPGAVGCLLTAILFSATTRWGWLRYGWIRAKWALLAAGFILGGIVLLPGLQQLQELAAVHTGQVLESSVFRRTWHRMVTVGSAHIAVLTIAFALSVFKPGVHRSHN